MTPDASGNPPPLPGWWDDAGDALLPAVPPPATPTPFPGPPRRPRRPRRSRAALLALVALVVLAAAPVAVLVQERAHDATIVSTPASTPPATPSEPSSPAAETARAAPTLEPPLESSATPTPSDPVPPSPVLDLLDQLEVKGRAQVYDYDRELFGHPWADVDRNGCDTRNDVLRRDLTDVVLKPDTGGCAVLTGTLVDPYSGQEMAFQRGPTTSSAVQIDHVVALADAWQKGAREWSDEQRVAFANDPLNLLAVEASLNQQKGAGDAATWLPPNRAYWCPYAARIVVVKARYQLWTTQAENTRLREILTSCPGEPLPDGLE